MFEHSFYEFRSLKRNLTPFEKKTLSRLAPQGEVTSRGFKVVYEEDDDDLNEDPLDLLTHYFDIFLNIDCWRRRRVALRLPKDALTEELVNLYLTPTTDSFCQVIDDKIIIDIDLLCEAVDMTFIDGEGVLQSITGIYDELLRGDLRPLYIAWLYLSLNATEDEDEDEEYEDENENAAADDASSLEPPLPPGLQTLTAAQQHLANLFELNPFLLLAAAEASLPLDPQAAEPLQAHLPDSVPTATPPPRRTFQTIEDRAFDLRKQYHAERAAHEARLLSERLDALAARRPEVWKELTDLLTTQQNTRYPEVIEHLLDLQRLAVREGHTEQFQKELQALQQRFKRLTSFQRLLLKSGLRPT